MTAAFGSFDRSPLGAFTQSPKLARGVRTAGIIQYSAFGGSRRIDDPYNTELGETTFNSFSRFFRRVGKSTVAKAGGFDLRRDRLGFTFQLAASYPGATNFDLKITFDLFENTMETFAPRVYASNTDDRALYALSGAWKGNLDNLVGDLTYGVFTEQTLAIPAPVLAARLGSGLSIIIGEDAELANAGASTPIDTTAHASISDFNGQILGFNLRLEYS